MSKREDGMKVNSKDNKVRITLNEDIKVKTETLASWEDWEIFVNEFPLGKYKEDWTIYYKKYIKPGPGLQSCMEYQGIVRGRN